MYNLYVQSERELSNCVEGDSLFATYAEPGPLNKGGHFPDFAVFI